MRLSILHQSVHLFLPILFLNGCYQPDWDWQESASLVSTILYNSQADIETLTDPYEISDELTFDGTIGYVDGQGFFTADSTPAPGNGVSSKCRQGKVTFSFVEETELDPSRTIEIELREVGHMESLGNWSLNSLDDFTIEMDKKVFRYNDLYAAYIFLVYFANMDFEDGQGNEYVTVNVSTRVECKSLR